MGAAPDDAADPRKDDQYHWMSSRRIYTLRIVDVAEDEYDAAVFVEKA